MVTAKREAKAIMRAVKELFFLMIFFYYLLFFYTVFLHCFFTQYVRKLPMAGLHVLIPLAGA